MAKYPLTELGHVAKDFSARHILSYYEIAEAITKETGVDIRISSFQQMRRDERGFETHRKVIMDYLRKRDPALVDASLTAYKEMYSRRES